MSKWNIITFHRCGNWAHRHKIPLVPLMVKFLIRLLFNSSVDPSTEIGEGTTFGYSGIGVVIHKNAVIGKNVIIGQGITIGGNGGNIVPVIEDNVYIGPGARIIGPVVVGKNSIIGVNAVVIKDVPKNAVVAGVPARILRFQDIAEDAIPWWKK